jgi:hypothetical protein
MARDGTVTEMITRLDSMLDIQNDTHVTTAEKITALSGGYAKFYDFLIEADFSDFLVKTATFSTVAGTQNYLLNTIATDFYKLRYVYVVEDGNRYRPIKPVQEYYIQNYTVPQVVKSIRVDYIPNAPVLSVGADVVNGINGWEDLIICYAALDICSKRDQEPAHVVRKQREIEERIRRMAQRDVGFPDKLIQRSKGHSPFEAYQNTIEGYRVRGLNLELYRYDPATVYV